jgi:hypothetical protein
VRENPAPADAIGEVSDTLERAGIESDPAGALPVFATAEATVASVRTR